MERFRHKTEEELQDQTRVATETLGVDISQQSLGSEIFKLPLNEIKEKYPERYEIYLKILRAQKNNREFDAKELQEMQEWISSLNNLDSYITKHTSHYEKFETRDRKQFDVFEDIRDSLEQGKKEGYIKLPTGVGKTVLFSRVVESLGLKTLIVVPSKILVNQTGEKLEEFTDMEFGKYFQGEKNLSENVTIITYSSLVKGIKNGLINPDDYQALIVDEAHKALGDETSKAVRQFKGVKLGFTATPKFSDDKHVSDLLEHEIHSMGIVEAAKEGLISRFKSYIAYTDTDISNVEVKNREKYNENELERAIDQEGRNQSAVELYKKEFNRQLAIAYCGGVTHAKHVAELFNVSGISAEIISGDTPDDDKNPNGKKAILERFRTGETKVLCNARILIEGFDEPKASVCLNLQPTLSLVDAEQRAGRVLRIDPENPDKWAYIVDFIDRNPKVAPRTFAEIAEASEVDGEHAVTFNIEHTGNVAGGERDESEKIPDVDIKGLRVVVDAREVLRVCLEFEELRNGERESLLSLEEFKTFCEERGITSRVEYIKYVNNLEGENTRIPRTINNFLLKYNLTPNEFFGKKKVEKRVFNITIDDLKLFCQENVIRNDQEYKSFFADPENADKVKDKPGNLRSFLSKHELTLNEFFGKDKMVSINLSVEELSNILSENGIKTPKDYYLFIRDAQNKEKVVGLPRSLKNYLRQFKISERELFGINKKEKITKTPSELKEFCLKNNIQSDTDYDNFAKSNHEKMVGMPKTKRSLRGFLKRFSLTFKKLLDENI